MAALNTTDNKELIDDNPHLKTAVTSVRNLISLINLSKAAPQISKKRGIIFCAKELCQLYFKLWKYNDCDAIVTDAENFLETSGIPIGHFSKSDLVSLKYFAGRISLFANSYSEAESDLEMAFKECHRDSFKNQRLILKYLIPTKICLSKFPTVELIKRYKLYEYVDLAKAVHEGNIALFRQQAEKYKRLWIKRSLFLTIEKMELVLIRNLVRRVCKLVKKTIVDTECLVKALNISKTINYDADEVECMLGNLIMKGFVKGYISHEKRKVVLSQNEPFPSFDKIFGNNKQ